MDAGLFVRKMVYWLTVLVTSFLGLRFVLRLFNANPVSDFVRWVYENTQPLLEPFNNIFSSSRLEGGFTIEFSTLFAILIYSLAGYLIVALVDAVTPDAPVAVVKKRR